jgi:hypothetical protein
MGMRIAHNRTYPTVEKLVIDQYQDGLGCTSICKKFNVNFCTVLNILRRNDIPIRNMRESKRMYYYNESFFEIIDTEEKAYWLGFILTDGCISVRNEWKKDLTITIKDKGHLEKFVKSINGNNKICQVIKKDGCKYVNLSIRCQKMVDDLIQLGITPRKSMTVIVPHILHHLYKHFWRGVIDGDGTMGFYVNKQRYNHKCFKLGLVGNLFIIESFRKYVKETLGIDLPIGKCKTIFETKTTNKKALKISTHLYRGATVFLDRKMVLAKRSFLWPNCWG